MKKYVKYAEKGKMVKHIMGWCPIPGANIKEFLGTTLSERNGRKQPV